MSCTSIPNHRFVIAFFLAVASLMVFLLLRDTRLIVIESRNVVEEIDLGSEDLRLEKVLKEAAMVDKTVILTSTNAAWARPGSTLDLFLESLALGENTARLVDHLVIVAFDQKAYARCRSFHSHCFALATEGVDFSGESTFMTTKYLKMVWRKIDFLRLVLEKGYDFIFTDTDVMWFRDPLRQLDPNIDFQIACDQFMGDTSGLNNQPNSGFLYAKSNNQTIELYKLWYLSRLKYPNMHDQDAFNQIKESPRLKEIGLKMRFLDTTYFGGFCQPSRDLNKVITMHANCCIGLSKKLQDLRTLLDDWARYKSLPPSVKGFHSISWSVPRNCR